MSTNLRETIEKKYHIQLLGEESTPHKLVFLHGLLGAGANWRKVAPQFEADFQVMLMDQRGHGRAHQPKTGYAPEDFAADLLEILDAFEWDKIHLVGHSMGGRNAMVFASKHPDRIERLVIEDISPDGNREGSMRIEKMLRDVPVPFTDKQSAKDYFEGFENRTLGMFLYTNISKSPDGTYDWKFYFDGIMECIEKGRNRDRWHEWDTIKVPTLLIRGENSIDLTQKSYEEMLSRQSNANGTVIEGAGHWVHYEKEPEFTKSLKRFL